MKFWFTDKIIELRLELQTFEEVIRRMPIERVLTWLVSLLKLWANDQIRCSDIVPGRSV